MLFGNPITDASTIAKRIADTIALKVPLREDRRDFVTSAKIWTKAAREVLRELGRDLHCETQHEKADAGTEKLYDVVWLSGRALLLAAEIEWKQKPEEIDYDFEKLLYAKSPLKLMVHQRQDQEVLPRLMEILVQYEGHVEGEEYIVIQLGDRKRKAKRRNLHALSFLVPTTGSLPEGTVSFRPVPGSPFEWVYPPNFVE